MFRDLRSYTKIMILLAVLTAPILLLGTHASFQLHGLAARTVKNTAMSGITERVRGQLETRGAMIAAYARSRATRVHQEAKQRAEREARRAEGLVEAEIAKGEGSRSDGEELREVLRELAATCDAGSPARPFIFLPKTSELLFPPCATVPFQCTAERSALLTWLSRLSARSGSGLLEYPQTDEAHPAASAGIVAYAAPVPAHGWLVGAVDALADERARAQQEVARFAQDVQVQGQEGLWLFDEKMRSVVAPPAEGALSASAEVHNALAAIRTVCLKNGSFYGLFPESDLGNGSPTPNASEPSAMPLSIVYWQLVPEWAWIVGAGTPIGHLTAQPTGTSSDLGRELRQRDFLVLLAAVLVWLVVFVLVLSVHRRTVQAAHAFALAIEEAVISHAPIDTSKIGLHDFRSMSARINQILAERKEVADRLRKSDEELFQAQKMEAVGRLAGGIAHDFNNLLTVIIGHAEMSLMSLRARGASETEYASLEEVRRSAMRGAGLTRQLLAFSRKEPVQLVPLSLNILLESLRAMIRPLIGEDVMLEIDLDKSLGLIEADRSQMEQVILNLVVNARDAMPAGGKLRISTRAVPLGPELFTSEPPAEPVPHVALEISDTGIGMDEETQRRIFEPFFTTKEKGKGTGLGLSTAYAIVTEMHGRITVSSEPGRGTTFCILFPELRAGSGEELGEHAEHPLVGGRETILVVEDDRNVRGFVASVLRGVGYTILEAPDGRKALDLLRAGRRIDMILSDVAMPELSGDRLIEELQAEHRQTPVLLMSGHVGQRKLRNYPIVEKPFTAAVICSRVRETLDGRSVRERAGEERQTKRT